jgi:hypothetical protein
MKTKYFLLAICLFGFAKINQAQSSKNSHVDMSKLNYTVAKKEEPTKKFMQSLDTIFISPEKTLIVTFENNQKISFINMETDKISNEIINGNSAIALKLKTTKEGFKQAKIVVNANNKYYGYLLKFSSTQTEIVHYLNSDNSLEKQNRTVESIGTNTVADDAQVAKMVNTFTSKNELAITRKKTFDSAAIQILSLDNPDGKYSDANGDCKLSLLSCHVYNDKLYFAVRISNNSSLTYDIDFIKFGTKFIKKSKNQAEQETEITPIYEYNATSVSVPSGRIVEKVFVLNKFTIDKKTKKFKLEAWEKNGERPLIVFYPSDKITNADQL